MLKAKFTFSGYQINQAEAGLEFYYELLTPKGEKIKFTEKLFFPAQGFEQLEKLPKNLQKALLDGLLLVLGISYWKTYCPKELVLKNIELSKEQAEFWNLVYTQGMGEFYYRNQIDFRGLVNFPYSEKYQAKPVNISALDRSLVLMGGGKDSIVTAELLKKEKKEFDLFCINEREIQRDVIKLVGKKSLLVKRELDQKLLALKDKPGVYNGHVPVSLQWGFISLVVAAVYGYRSIVVSNEKSANYGNVEYLGQWVNHQWSKSEQCEQAFNRYIQENITPDIRYYSFLRAYSELEIVKMFFHYPQYFPVFSSCNANFKITDGLKGKKWCGHCPKCVFVFTLLAAYLSKKELLKIFGQNLFANEKLVPLFEELLGIRNIKPFECVGTPEEMKAALKLVEKKEDYQNDYIVQYFKA